MSDTEVSFEYLKSLEGNKNVLLIDVREPTELEKTGVIPGSINIPLATLEKTLTDSTYEEFRETYDREKPELETPLVFSCQSGRRSLAALNIAMKLGYLK
ncbi:Rhodanese domain containing protein [Asbolus verrucosus]|uniref:Rhodanese domain containing protein n=1 Tax=Asbolus verrucosus TaxID=1661398 RepID=A0A482VDR9_ASBVE|nr:Rhodanese domain containing protein [Asbolus verrucosus]